MDSTPVECARSREIVKGSDLAGWAKYGYCASNSRFFWGLRLHTVCTLRELPLAWPSPGPKPKRGAGISHLVTSIFGLGAIGPSSTS